MSRKKLSQGMIQVYTGNGKGKTTAALGLACRAAGYGYRTFMIQFMKGNLEYGELETAKKLPSCITIRQMGRETFVDPTNPHPEDIKLAQEALALSREVVLSGEYDVVVLDEINVAVHMGLVDKEAVLRLLDERPSHVEVVLTGRGAAPEIIEKADLVTEMVEVKHYYSRGVQSRKGIEM